MTAISFKLTPEEQAYEDAIQAGEYVSISNLDEVKEHLKQAAINTDIRKKISLRLPQGDLQRIKLKAQKLGMPYQTLINSVLHQYATGSIG